MGRLYILRPFLTACKALSRLVTHSKFSRLLLLEFLSLWFTSGRLFGFSINVSKKDTQSFLITGAILVIVSKFGMESVLGSLLGIGVGDIVSSTFAALLTLFVPATIVVALITLFGLAKV